MAESWELCLQKQAEATWAKVILLNYQFVLGEASEGVE
jgi:hypothetical protein